MSSATKWNEALRDNGFAVVPGVYDQEEMAALARSIASMVTDGPAYAARNLIDRFPPTRDVWRRPALLELLHLVLGPEAGLVRALWFDKPPGKSWALPWHKDLTVAVREHGPSERFRRPTTKEGVTHYEAPEDVLQRMLTLRLHLDDADDENGALRVQPGSHAVGKTMAGEWPIRTIEAKAGDVLAMRPLLAHCSNGAKEGTTRNRRVLHLEFAAGELGDGLEWRWLIPARAGTASPPSGVTRPFTTVGRSGRADRSSG